VVTGASRAWEGNCLGSSGAGADIALYARNREDLEAVKVSVEALGRRAEIFCVDVLDKALIDENVKATLEAFGHIDILANNAGVNVRKPVLELSAEEWDLVIDTNLKGYFLMAQAVVAHAFPPKRQVMYGSSWVQWPFLQLAYASSKGKVIR
jgi:NADP-dependent 3-hydroxy acid dehydrogenase YdfG